MLGGVRTLAALSPILTLAIGCNTPPTPSQSGSPQQPTSSSLPAAGSGEPRSATVVEPYGPLPSALYAADPDGIPFTTVTRGAAQKTGDVVWVSSASEALTPFPEYEASDGESIYFARRDAASVLVRGGKVIEKPLARYGIEKGGCAAAYEGRLFLSGVGTSDADEEVVHVEGNTRRIEKRKAAEQRAVIVDANGRDEVFTAGPSIGPEEDCQAIAGADGTFALMLFEPLLFDGKTFSKDERAGLGWFSGRTVMGSPRGPRFCFESCNATEAAETHPMTKKLVAALDFQGGASPEWIAMGDWVAGARAGRAVRAKIGGAIETVEGIPASKMLNGSMQIAFTRKGSLVIALDYRFEKYVVWPVGKSALSPVRTLQKGEILSSSSPTLLVRGFDDPLPESSTFAVVGGKNIGVGTGGSTYGYSGIRSGPDAHAARAKRAHAVMGKASLVFAREAAIDPACGTYVRSPIGWEGERIHDWSPPVLPALSPRAVTRPAACMTLTSLAVVPGTPDLILGISGGELHAAWLPPPLPLPAGVSHFDRQKPGPAPVQKPQPGTGWLRVGKVDAIVGDAAIADPGGNTAIADGSWGALGAAVITADGREILLAPLGAVTLPQGTRPMAIGQNKTFQAWGAIGSKIVVCATTCRILDPGPKENVVAIVPRTETALALGYADGRIGVYEVPQRGGEEVPAHPLTAALADLSKRRPRDPPSP